MDEVSISLWETTSHADNHNTNTYPQVMKSMERVIDGTPRFHTFETVTPTYNKGPVTLLSFMLTANHEKLFVVLGVIRRTA